MSELEEWRPGSFTKNFSWGAGRRGLVELHEILRLGFDGKVEDVPRSSFRRRVKRSRRPDYIPINFFLFNRPFDGVDHIVADELVFQAINFDHSRRFDKLAVFAFNLSYAGIWKGAQAAQRYPALWAKSYIRDRVASSSGWHSSRISANDIERFVEGDARYKAQGARKLATNLSHLYRIGGISEMATGVVERWWVDALFLALDRAIEDFRLSGTNPPESQYASLLNRSGFLDLGGLRSLEKEMASKHLVRLYVECGGRERFSPEHVRERTQLRLPDLELFIANDDRPQGAVHPTNARILKSIPRVCAMLARYAGFDIIDADELEGFETGEFIRNHTRMALEGLKARGIKPSMTAEELLKITREQ
jgi:hypothetical protein